MSNRKKHSSKTKRQRSRRRRRHYTCRVCCKWVRKRHSKSKKKKSHDLNENALIPFLARNNPQLVQAQPQPKLPQPPPQPPPQLPAIPFLRGGDGVVSTPIRRANQLAELKRACPNPEFCIDVGNLEEPIESFFKHFRDLNLVNRGKIRRIGGKKGKNGFVLKLPFEEDNYAAWTVLKCVADPAADNLALEAWTGLHFINRFVKRFPCFVKTYGLWKIGSFENYSKLSRITDENADSLFNPRPVSLSDALTYLPEVPPPAQMCRDAQFFAVMIQHFGRFQSLGDAFGGRVQHTESLCILFQIYFVLTQLQPHFTHYDLHWHNVGLYQPFADPDDYIEMHYHLSSGETIVFPCPFIAKILDYGRAYVDISGVSSSGSSSPTTTDTLFRAVCDEPSCAPQCGTNYGFRAFTGKKAAEHYITPNKWNPSIDLRLANILNDMTKRNHNNMPLFNEKVRIQYRTDHGTPPNPNNGYDVKQQQFNIHNITDLFHHLADLFKATPGTPMPPFLQSASLVGKLTHSWESAAHVGRTSVDGFTQPRRNVADVLNAQYAFGTKRAVMHVYAASSKPYSFEIINPNTQLANHPSITPDRQATLYKPAPQAALPDVATLVEDENKENDERSDASASPGHQVQRLRTRLFPADDFESTPTAKRPRW